MDKVKRMLSSPVIARRVSAMPSTSQPPRYFGVPLDELVRREGSTVPSLVTKICEHIEAHGLQYEGLFRVNGNARSVDRIRASFDTHGDADFTDVDMTALASTLKMFLREIPSGVVPERNTRAFVTVQQANENAPSQCVHELRALIAKLPSVNRDILRYLCRFLVLVADHEPENKMSAHALAIVFGPNLFRFPSPPEDRCSFDLVGLKEQGVTNFIVTRFLKDYDSLFPQDSQDNLQDGIFTKRGPPKRPPPPKFNSDSADPAKEMSSTSSPNHVIADIMDDDSLDTGRSMSPFPVDSDRSECGSAVATPRVTPFHSQQVEMAITSVVSHHLFYDSPPPGSSGGSGQQTSDTPPTPGNAPWRTDTAGGGGAHNAPVPAPRRKWRPKAAGVQPQPVVSASNTITEHKSDPDSEDEGHNLTVQQRIQQLTERKVVPVSTQTTMGSRQVKQRPKSRAFELFESQGILIGMGPHRKVKPTDDDEVEKSDELIENNNESSVKVEDLVDSERLLLETNEKDRESLEVIKWSSSTLMAFKRAPGPKNRRMPSRGAQHVHHTTTTTPSPPMAPRPEPLATTAPRPEPLAIKTSWPEPLATTAPRPEPLATTVPWPEPLAKKHHPDENSISMVSPPSIRFLSCPVPYLGQGDGVKVMHKAMAVTSSPSSNVTPKPFIPPLDLSILHEHVDGGDAILVDQGHSLQQTLNETAEAVVSPRMCKLRRKTNPQRHDDDEAIQIKQITKKIQSYKRKIKAFEESFEREHGYRPSQSDKATKPDVKRHIVELARARKDLKRLKEEAENEPPQVTAAPQYSPSRPHRGDDPSSVTPVSDPAPSVCNAAKMEETLRGLMQKLAAKRQDALRPDELVTMSYSEIQEEKLAVQKALLYFESIHGRPSTKSEKDIMRPLYDRYRNVKKLLAKPLSPHEKSFELATVPEDTAIELGSTNCLPGASGDGSSLRPAIHIPTAAATIQDEFDCLVTQLCLPDSLDVHSLTTESGVRPHHTTVMTGEDASPAGPRRLMSASSSLHELSLHQLQREQQLMFSDKKQLRKQLRSFEENFFTTTGRKVQKEDRAPMESEYHDYKQIKARLKLLDALISKHNGVESEA